MPLTILSYTSMVSVMLQCDYNVTLVVSNCFKMLFNIIELMDIFLKQPIHYNEEEMPLALFSNTRKSIYLREVVMHATTIQLSYFLPVPKNKCTKKCPSHYMNL